MSDLLKHRQALPENHHCITCSQTSQNHYVCIDFGTFICGVCASIHRELGFRVKAINLSKFTPEEVEAITGNGLVKQSYFARWDHHSEPVPSVTQKDDLKQFVYKAFVEKKWHISTPQYSAPSHPAKLPQSSLPSYYTPQTKPETSIPMAMDNSNHRAGGFAVKTFESPSVKPPYFDLSKPLITPMPEPSPVPQNPNLLADWGYKHVPQTQPQTQPQYINPPSAYQPINNPYSIEPVTPIYDQKPNIPKPPDSFPKMDPPPSGSSPSTFPFFQQPQRPPPRPVIEQPPPPVHTPSPPVVIPSPIQPQQPPQVPMVMPMPNQPIQRPPSYNVGPDPTPQIPGSMHGGYVQFAPSHSVVYPASYPQKIPQVNQVPQPIVYNGSPGTGYVMLPQGQVMAIPQGQVMAIPQPGNRGFPAVAPKGIVIVPSTPNTIVQPQQRLPYAPNTMPQQPQPQPQIQVQQQYYQQQQQPYDAGYTNDINLKKKQIEDDEALARRLQEEENRNAY